MHGGRARRRAAPVGLLHRCLSDSKSSGKALQEKGPDDVGQVKNWGSGLELREISKKEAEARKKQKSGNRDIEKRIVKRRL